MVTCCQAQLGDNDIASLWNDAHRFSPAPRHRRRIITNIISRIKFISCLDAGCAQPYLLDKLRKRGKQVSGCDISSKVIEANKKELPGIDFEIVDISKGVYPQAKKFDLVISSEVLEHIYDWPAALANLACMSGHYLLITVPSGKINKIDTIVGHLRHFTLQDLEAELNKNNFRVVYHKFWGAPFHSLYKYFINGFDYQKTYRHFAARPYGLFEKLLSHFLFVLFYFNDLLASGSQLFILAERNST
jgi:hypothetical protein